MNRFELSDSMTPRGDQPQAIDQLADGLADGKQYQTLLGVTGSGKTFTMANVISRSQRPTLVISHNKTLAAQLYEEFRELFPENAVEYFVSYYDYYQPEAYIPQRDIYIEKDASRNDDLDRLRMAATSSLLRIPEAPSTPICRSSETILSHACVYSWSSAAARVINSNTR